MIIKKNVTRKLGMLLILSMLLFVLLPATKAHAASGSSYSTTSDQTILSNNTKSRTISIRCNYGDLIVSMFDKNGKCLWSSDWSNENVLKGEGYHKYKIGSNVKVVKVRMAPYSAPSTYSWKY